MIDTVNSKPRHYTHGSFCIGSGPTVILIEGSCRVIPCVNYFDYLNADNRFTIHLINVVNICFDVHDNKVNPAEHAQQFESNPHLLDTIRKTKWFIHEHAVRFGMLNTDKTCPKNIYQFGMNPDIDISLPNFNDVFILAQELVDIDPKVKKIAKEDYAAIGQLSPDTKAVMRLRGMTEINKFLNICAKTSLPEFAAEFAANWKSIRYFWTGSHVSKEFTTTVFRMMNERYLKLKIDPEAFRRIHADDMYATPASPVTRYDVENYGINWPQAVQELKV